MQLVVCKHKVSVTSLCSTAAPDCSTGQSQGRYGARVQSYSIWLLDTCQLENFKRVTTFTSWLICRQAVETGQLAIVAAAEAAQ